jgi:hypothetical protein
MFVQVHNQSISETTFGMMSDFIGSFTMFPKKDEPRGNKALPSSLLIFRNAQSTGFVRYFILSKKNGCHCFFTLQYKLYMRTGCYLHFSCSKWLHASIDLEAKAKSPFQKKKNTAPFPHAKLPKIIIMKPYSIKKCTVVAQILEILISPCPDVDETLMQNHYAVRQAVRIRELGNVYLPVYLLNTVYYYLIYLPMF